MADIFGCAGDAVRRCIACIHKELLQLFFNPYLGGETWFNRTR